MSTTLTVGSIQARVVWTYESVLSWGNAVNSSYYSYEKSLADGAGASQANRIYMAMGTIAASDTLTLDLAGSLADIFGNTITFARIKTFYFELTTDSAATSVGIGGAGSNTFINWVGAANDVINVRNGGCMLLSAIDATGYAVTATTGDQLLFTNNDGAAIATYKLVLVGAAT